MSERTSTATSHRSPQPQAQFHRLGLLLGLLAAFALRLFHLGSESLWYDETVSVVLARESIPALLAHTAGDIHPPGYYLLLHFWQQLTAPSVAHGLEFLFAWPSLCWGMLIVALTYALGRRLCQPPIALLALWLAAIHPYQIWYSQEVRMYTLGALLGLLTLWALLNYVGLKNREITNDIAAQLPMGQWRWLIGYALFGALGLYTLYYFLFLLLTLNLIALWLLFRFTGSVRASVLAIAPKQQVMRALLAWRWIAANGLLLLFWLPWLPIFWRQATDPPVPPWRAPWQSVAEFGTALRVSVSAYLSGQSAPAPTHWLWLLIGLLLLATTLFFYAKQKSERCSLLLLMLYTVLPPATLLVLSVVAAPLYHVRYLILYAPPFVLLLAVLLQKLYQQSRLVAGLLLLLLIGTNGWSLRTFWYDPAYQSDDHRAAVAQLAAEWRPGDLILVNAGWVYTALETYWPTELDGAHAATPPPLQEIARLHDYANKINQLEKIPTAPVVIRSGSVDGNANLGWGNAESDFFALDAAATTTALETLAQKQTRLWHYRLYDTVNDPDALIRSWLETHSTPLLDQPIPGRDFLRLQLYRFEDQEESGENFVAGRAIATVAGLHLLTATPLTTTITAGSTSYVTTRWQRTASATPLPPIVSLSLRLYNDQKILLAQHDETPLDDPRQWATGTSTTLTLALPIPVATQPGDYSLQLLLYDGSTGAAIVPIDSGDQGPSILLGTLTVAPAERVPLLDTPLLHFDYIDLLALQVSQQPIGPGSAIPVTLLWRPQPSSYRDTYLMAWTLLDQMGDAVESWQEPLGGWHYPSGVWQAQQPLLQPLQLAIDPTLPSGTYQLTMQLIRASDGQPIAPRRFWWQWRPWPQTTPPAILPDSTLFIAEIAIK